MSMSSSVALHLIFFQSLKNLELADELGSLANELSGSARVFSSSGIADEHRHAWLSRGIWRTLHKVSRHLLLQSLAPPVSWLRLVTGTELPGPA